MKIYKYGNKEKPILLLVPPYCYPWRAVYENVLPKLKDKFQVLLVSFDGFDGNRDSVFSSVETEVLKIENYVLKNCHGVIDGLYESSMGGVFSGTLLQRGKIQVKHIVFSASDLDGKIFGANRFYLTTASSAIFQGISKKKVPGWISQWIHKRPKDEQKYMSELISLLIQSNHENVQKKSIHNMLVSVLKVRTGKIVTKNSRVICLYDSKMGRGYQRYYKERFDKLELREQVCFPEEMLVRYPERWLEVIEEIL